MLRHASYEIFVAKNYNKHSHVGSYSERDNWSQTGALADSAEIIQYRYTLYAIRERYCISESQIQHDGIPCTGINQLPQVIVSH